MATHSSLEGEVSLIDQTQVRNILLRSLTPEQFALAAPSLRPVTLQMRQTLLSEGELIGHVYFPEAGVCSVVTPTYDGDLVEVGIFSFEGCTDNVLAPGLDRSTFRTIVQIPGDALVMTAAEYTACLKSSNAWLQTILRFSQTLTTQIAYTSTANASLTVHQRLARWLLMLQDRIGDRIPIVQEWLSIMLCTSRSFVSEVIQKLEATGAISTTRGQITIRNRGQLVALCASVYGQAEQEYERVFNLSFRAHPDKAAPAQLGS